MVEWSEPAKKDLRQIHDYIAEDSRFYAKKVINEIVEKSESLNDFPQIGRVVPEIEDPNIRELFIYSYRLIYETLPENLTILAIVHSKRDFNKKILSREQ